MCEGHRSVEDLLNATEDAPRFGLNARELILQAASRIAAQVKAPCMTMIATIEAISLNSIHNVKICPL